MSLDLIINIIACVLKAKILKLNMICKIPRENFTLYAAHGNFVNEIIINQPSVCVKFTGEKGKVVYETGTFSSSIIPFSKCIFFLYLKNKLFIGFTLYCLTLGPYRQLKLLKSLKTTYKRKKKEYLEQYLRSRFIVYLYQSRVEFRSISFLFFSFLVILRQFFFHPR